MEGLIGSNLLGEKSVNNKMFDIWRRDIVWRGICENKVASSYKKLDRF